jgi:acetyl esterase/lipase
MIDPVANIDVQAGLAMDQVYHTVDGIELKADVLFSRIYVGEDPWWEYDGKKRPALLYIHGGGWVEGEKETRMLGLLPFISKGWVVININYRLADVAKAPAAVEDCLRALQWIYDSADGFGVDTDRIVVAGESAGGHLALMTGMLEEGDVLCDGKFTVDPKKSVAAIINWYGPADFTIDEGIKGHPWFDIEGDTGEILRSLSPISYADKDNPAIITIHGDADPLVDVAQSIKLHARLDEVGAKNKLVIIPGKKHGNFNGEERTHIFKEIWCFLQDNGVDNAAK